MNLQRLPTLLLQKSHLKGLYHQKATNFIIISQALFATSKYLLAHPFMGNTKLCPFMPNKQFCKT